MSLALASPTNGAPVVADVPASVPGRFADLPIAAKAYFALVMAAGAGALVLPDSGSYGHWTVFFTVLVAAAVASLLRVDLPFSLHGATMSLSFTFAFASLLLLGPHPTLIVATVAAWVQCTCNTAPRNPLHRTAFSMAALAVTAKASAFVFLSLGGEVAFAAPGLAGQEKAILGAALTYFVLNTLLTATAVSITSGQPLPKGPRQPTNSPTSREAIASVTRPTRRTVCSTTSER